MAMSRQGTATSSGLVTSRSACSRREAGRNRSRVRQAVAAAADQRSPARLANLSALPLLTFPDCTPAAHLLRHPALPRCSHCTTLPPLHRPPGTTRAAAPAG